MPPGPYRNPGVASDPDFEGNVYAGSDHWLFFSTFDTEKDCPWSRRDGPRRSEGALREDAARSRSSVTTTS
jgi:hypothetical protein